MGVYWIVLDLSPEASDEQMEAIKATLLMVTATRFWSEVPAVFLFDSGLELEAIEARFAVVLDPRSDFALIGSMDRERLLVTGAADPELMRLGARRAEAVRGSTPRRTDNNGLARQAFMSGGDH